MTQQTQTEQFLTAYVNGHYLGLPIRHIQDIIGPHQITRIPLAKSAIAGILNLRGRIVTAVDVKERFGESTDQGIAQSMGIIVENRDELFSLLVDQVEDVMTIDHADIEKAPPTLNPVWLDACLGVYQLKDKIMIIIDPEKILDLNTVKA